jgi:hypothetical protein
LESLDTFKSDDATPLPPKRSHENSKSNIGEVSKPPKPDSGSGKLLSSRKSAISARSEDLSVQNSRQQSHASLHSNRFHVKSDSALPTTQQPTIDITEQAPDTERRRPPFKIQPGLNSGLNSSPNPNPQHLTSTSQTSPSPNTPKATDHPKNQYTILLLFKIFKIFKIWETWAGHAKAGQGRKTQKPTKAPTPSPTLSQTEKGRVGGGWMDGRWREEEKVRVEKERE